MHPDLDFNHFPVPAILPWNHPWSDQIWDTCSSKQQPSNHNNPLFAASPSHMGIKKQLERCVVGNQPHIKFRSLSTTLKLWKLIPTQTVVEWINSKPRKNSKKIKPKTQGKTVKKKTLNFPWVVPWVFPWVVPWVFFVFFSRFSMFFLLPPQTPSHPFWVLVCIFPELSPGFSPESSPKFFLFFFEVLSFPLSCPLSFFCFLI